MGRSQVERNRAARGRGRGGGRGSGRGGGSGGRAAGSRSHKRSSNVVDEGDDNSFRYHPSNDTSSSIRTDKNTSADDNDDEFSSWLFDEVAFDGGYAFLGEQEEEDCWNESEVLVTKILNSMDGSQHCQQRQKQQQPQQASTERRSIMSIDIKKLNKCLQQTPIHKRLRLPHYLGRHLEENYGLGNIPAAAPAREGDSSGRKERMKKSLAQLREESRCILRDDEEYEKCDRNGNNEDGIKKLEGLTVAEDADTVKSNPFTLRGGENEVDDDDLEAWLDDMIA